MHLKIEYWFKFEGMPPFQGLRLKDFFSLAKAGSILLPTHKRKGEPEGASFTLSAL